MCHGVKIILSLLLCLIVVTLSIAPCFAVGMVFDLANLGQLMWDAYASSHGIGVYYTSSGRHNSYGDEFDESVFQAAWNELYDKYAAYANLAQSAASWASEQIQNITIFQTPVDGSTEQYVGFEMDTPLVEWYDGFTNWLLGVEMGIPSDSGHYHTSGSFGPNNIASSSSISALADYMLPVDPGVSNWYSSTFYVQELYNNKSYIYYFYANNSTADIYAFCVNNIVYLVSQSSNSSIIWYAVDSNNPSTIIRSISYQDLDSGLYYYENPFIHNVVVNSFPSFNSVTDGLNYIKSKIGTGDNYYIALAPKEKIRNDGGDIYIPNPSDINYIPQRITKPTNIPWDNAYEGNPDLALNAMKDAVRANDDILELDDALTPSPVINPFIPFNFPSFNFNFSGIWHYVVSWIGSLRSGFAFISSCWASLPYQMVIPIYASAVIVIVIGTYKRFFT